MPRKAKNKDAAWRIFEWFFGEAPAKARASSGWGIPSLKSLRPLMPAEEEYQKRTLKAQQNELRHFSVVALSPYISGDAFEALFNQVATPAMNGAMSVDTLAGHLNAPSTSSSSAEGASRMTTHQLPTVADRSGSTADTGRTRPAERPRTSMTARRHRAFYMFTSPWIIGFTLLTIAPMAFALWLSFTTYDGISPHWHYVGLGNYRELMGDSQTWHALGRAGLFAVMSVPLSIIAGLALAVLVNRAAQGARTVPYPALPPGRGAAGGRGHRLQEPLRPELRCRQRRLDLLRLRRDRLAGRSLRPLRPRHDRTLGRRKTS